MTSASPKVTIGPITVGTPQSNITAVWDTTRRPSSQRVGAFLLVSMLPALHQAGDRYFSDPTATPGSSRNAPVAHDGRRFSGGPRVNARGAADIFAA
jgi:hypothetical protein